MYFSIHTEAVVSVISTFVMKKVTIVPMMTIKSLSDKYRPYRSYRPCRAEFTSLSVFYEKVDTVPD